MPKLLDVIKRDHANITSAYQGLITKEPDDRDPDAFIWALSRYLIVENLALLPALEYHNITGNGNGERQRRLSDDYDSIHTKLRHMIKYEPSEESFVAALRAIWVDLEPHIREERDGDMAELEEKMGPEDSEALAKKYETLRDMLQKPYGKEGVPDAETLKDVLETTRQELMERMGMGGV